MEASKILGIEVLDHVIIAGAKHFSFQSHGLLIK
jgi:DNA repair protein RadC